jgi:aspartate/methionine/tyrosine aminotransferase
VHDHATASYLVRAARARYAARVFAQRASWDLEPNELSARLAARRALGLPICDLTLSNPTQCGLELASAALTRAIGALEKDPALGRYEPDPRGPAATREAIASLVPGVSPEHVILTAGTSEACAQLFRVLADPGDRIHVATPGYPLFDHVAGLEGLDVARYALRPPARGARWRIDFETLARELSARSRAILLVHPHNPTGSWVDPADWAELAALARARDLALVSDEVFSGSSLPGESQLPSALDLARGAPLCFALSGASKLLGLPQLKLAWIAAGGAPELRDAALARLEFASDAFLSVSPLLARMLPALLAERGAIQAEIRARVAQNRAALASAVAASPQLELLPAEAGWAAILRLRGADASAEESLTLELLERHGVLVHPGFFFDLEPPDGLGPCAHWVLGLLLEPEPFARGAAALVESVAELRSARSS